VSSSTKDYDVHVGGDTNTGLRVVMEVIRFAAPLLVSPLTKDYDIHVGGDTNMG
jgi:hypothetical protein